MKNLLTCLAMLAGFNVHAQWNSNADVDQDGCVGVGDVLEILSVFGSCAPSMWQCGDSLFYEEYWYKTVEIDDQCWFAENLRTSTYRNGDSIPDNLSNSEWVNTIEGAKAVYNDDDTNIQEYGCLYNWLAVNDPRGLCPSGWHIPRDEEWTALEVYITSLGFEGTEGQVLKETGGWCCDGSGTDEFGFSARPGGWRYGPQGYFNYLTERGLFWSSSLAPDTSCAYSRHLKYDSTELISYSSSNSSKKRNGFSVRCQNGELQGCTNPAYIEFEDVAVVDDGSCSILALYGCTDSAFEEFDAAANVDDGTCATILGCLDPAYLEFNIDANVDDGSCVTVVSYGCTDSLYSEFNAEANFDDGSCASLYGCTDSSFFEFNPEAIADNGSCISPIVFGCTNSAYLEFVAEANVFDDSCLNLVDSSACAPVGFDGYTYDVIQIGDQCWFAENLRTLQRSNGQSLSHNNPTIYNGPMDPAIYNDPSQAGVVDPNYDASLVNEYGRFYNGAAAFLPLDSGGICPSGWRVPCRVDFEELWTNTYALNDPLINASQGCSCDNTGMWSTDAVSFGNLEDSCALAEEYLEMESLSIAESCSDWYYYGYQDSSTCVEEELALNAANFDFSLWYGTEWYCPNNSSIRSGFNAKPVGIMVPTNDEPWVYVGENAWFYCAGTICDSGDHVTILSPESYVGHGGSNYWPIRCIKNE